MLTYLPTFRKGVVPSTPVSSSAPVFQEQRHFGNLKFHSPAEFLNREVGGHYDPSKRR